MNLDSKIYIAGHRSLVGSALLRRLAASRVRPTHHGAHGVYALQGAPYSFIVLKENQKSEISFIINMLHENNPRSARLPENDNE